jgi:methylthioribose-1-phosphate isomerase
MPRDPLKPLPTIRWVGGRVRILDQTLLPRREVLRDLSTTAQLIRAIQSLAVRGAPALGIAGAYGVALAARRAHEGGRDPVSACEREAVRLAGARPTAVNLRLGVARAMEALRGACRGDLPPRALLARVEAAGTLLLEEDLEASRRMGSHGLPCVPPGQPVLTHCNTGGLATGGLGTALAVARLAASTGRIPEILVGETRPLLQGGRLTLWELRRFGIPARLLCDGAAAWAMARLGVGCVLVGADRVAENGDTANKVGTYSLALAARAHGIPLYVVAPRTSFDPATADGSGIRVEERGPAEVARASGWSDREGVTAFNPAFDVTPAGLIEAWITDRGVERPPFGG